MDAKPSARNLLHTSDDDDDDTASQRSISLSSPPGSNRASMLSVSGKDNDSMAAVDLGPDPADDESKRVSKPYTVDTDFSSEADDMSFYNKQESPPTSIAPSILDDEPAPVTYPPKAADRVSLSDSMVSMSSKKARPESMIILPDRLVLGVALVDFNHVVGPRIEWSVGEIFEDEEVGKIIPFLALPDGAHLSAEDFSYFHLVPPGLKATTVFGISCNQQIAAAALLVKMPDVTRSTVQKAVVVLASKPIFGPIRDKLGVVTTALFHQKDFTDLTILEDFADALEPSLRGQLTESGFYMGTSLRELVHAFRQRTLVLVKALLLQKRIMFYGHPVERLCTYQYSLISLLPGLLNTLDDCGSPPLATRAPTLTRPASLKTSDPKSMMAYTGFPLDIFGKDAFFQPYLPLQQMDMLKETKSWLCGTTNTIVTQHQAIDLLVNTETGTVEFKNPNVERLVGLTAADRKWMDEIITDVNEGWDDANPTQPLSMQFKGSDDYLREKFDEYIGAALSTVRYRDFMAKGEGSGVIITGGTGSVNPWEDFNPLWVADFKTTNVHDVWEKTTDPMLFDIVEPRHPCTDRVTVVSDISLRLSEGIQELKLEQQLAPVREAAARNAAMASAGFFKAVDNVKTRWMARSPGVSPGASEDGTPVNISPDDVADAPPKLARQGTMDSVASVGQPLSPRQTISSWGSGFGAWAKGLSSNRSSVDASASSPPPLAKPPQRGPRPLSLVAGPNATSVLPSRNPPSTPLPGPVQEKDEKDEPAGMGMAM
ncbi:hypothetical protein CYLTODRAFT_418366 [Cylindrobasidium torrendii FP15055 ss-10]|uniref:UDENN domain-containing protein n=1 Tax=Cylindrobasidium torrendii FP15055 ss-10 TaxID=1314674 RepID=A0A0D7BN53_9AGAR|nr:hypothetical protein CYLTODRAFT_418366 [Cylindrobasidium torrendii FP15055 ss-10]